MNLLRWKNICEKTEINQRQSSLPAPQKNLENTENYDWTSSQNKLPQRNIYLGLYSGILNQC